jgi:hypothetical protein
VPNSTSQTPPDTVLDPTEARQGSPSRINLRVLIGSMAALIIIGAVLVGAFWKATPAGMDAKPTGAEKPASTSPASAPVTTP